MNKRTGLKFSDLFQAKNDIIGPTCVEFSRWRQGGYSVSSVICDNAGDNFKLEQAVNEKYWKMEIKF